MLGSLVFAGLAAVAVAFSTVVVVKLQRAENAEAKAEFERYRIETGETIAKANESAARANEAAELLRKDNLALQRLMQPRRLGALIAFRTPGTPKTPPLGAVQFEGIKLFAGTPVLIQVVPDFEAQTLANDMRFVLNAFGWKPAMMDEAMSKVPPSLISEGVQVTFPPDSKFVKAAQALAEGFTKAGLSGPSGWTGPIMASGYSDKKPDGSPAIIPGNPKLDPAIDAVIVLVGMKPIPQPAQ